MALLVPECALGQLCLSGRDQEGGAGRGDDRDHGGDGEGVREAADGPSGDAGRGDGGQHGDADAAADPQPESPALTRP